MKDQILNFWQDNKKPIIQIGGTVLGGLIGLGLTILVIKASEDEVIEIDDFEVEE